MKNQNQKQASQPRLRSFPQRLRAEVDGRVLSTGLASLEELPVIVKVPCSLHSESVRYAACRAFVKSASLQGWALRRSYRLRVGGRCCPREQHFCLQLPISFFALDEGQAFAAFSVSAERICLTRVWLLPAGEPAPRRVSVQLTASAQPLSFAG